jgi:hypothetical protein
VQVFEAGEHEGAPYLVMELLEGETLRERLHGKALPPKRAAELARDVAQGLAAAHGKGILHRDLKPENIFLTKDGRVKVLDFGLAKLKASAPIGQESATRTCLSEPGTVVGTSGYMSPEQVQGAVLDARSDLFSLGVVLWEMITGGRPFQRDSALETMHAILKDELPELDETLKLPPALERILRTCLEKEPAGRFHSAHDLAFALDSLSSSGSSSTRLPKVQDRRFGWALPATAGAGLALALGILAWFRHWPPFALPAQPTFTRLTFGQGQIREARFTPDQREVIFDAAWDGNKPQLYSTSLDTLEEKPLGIPGATLLYLTPTGDLGVALGARNEDEHYTKGDLAKAPPGGTAPKPMLKDVLAADQAPDGRLALATAKDYPATLEFPQGQGRAKLTLGGTFRFSRDGRWLAFIGGYAIRVLDTATGAHRRLSRGYGNINGLAWKGDEVWFTAGRLGKQQSLRAVTLAGKERVVLEAPGRFRLMDVEANGRALLAQEDYRVGILHWGPGQDKPKDLTRGDDSFLTSLAKDGSQVVFGANFRRNRKDEGMIFLSPVNGRPQVISDGWYSILSPDGSWVATLFAGKEQKVVVYPTGPGQERTLPLPGLKVSGNIAWTLDNKALLVQGNEAGRPERVYLLPLDGGALRPLTPEGVSTAEWPGLNLAPDGRHFLAKMPGYSIATPGGLGIYDLQHPEGPPTPVKPFEGNYIGWTADSRRLYILSKRTLPVEVWVLDPLTGSRKPFRTFTAESLPGAEVIPWACRITADGRHLAVTYFRKPSTLYLVEGLS